MKTLATRKSDIIRADKTFIEWAKEMSLKNDITVTQATKEIAKLKSKFTNKSIFEELKF
jgi:hypothetical protein